MDVDEKQSVGSPAGKTLQEEGDATEGDFRMTVPQASEADASELQSPAPEPSDAVDDTPIADNDSGAEDQESFKFLEFPSLLDPSSWCFVPQAAAASGILKGEEGMLNSIENWGEEDLRCMLDEVNAAKAAALDRVDVLRVLSRVVLRKIAEPSAGGDAKSAESVYCFSLVLLFVYALQLPSPRQKKNDTRIRAPSSAREHKRRIVDAPPTPGGESAGPVGAAAALCLLARMLTVKLIGFISCSVFVSFLLLLFFLFACDR